MPNSIQILFSDLHHLSLSVRLISLIYLFRLQHTIIFTIDLSELVRNCEKCLLQSPKAQVCKLLVLTINKKNPQIIDLLSHKTKMELGITQFFFLEK